MTLGQFREYTASCPADTVIVVPGSDHSMSRTRVECWFVAKRTGRLGIASYSEYHADTSLESDETKVPAIIIR